MDNHEVFYRVLKETNAIALATAVDGVPNVRIVNFCYDEKRPGVLYFASDRENGKVAEFSANGRVAFTTIPPGGASVPHVRSKDASVVKSNLTINQVQDLFIAKVPGYDETIAAIGESLDVFEIHVREAVVAIDFEKTLRVSFR